MNLNLCIVCLIRKNELVHYMILAMSIGPLYVIVIYYINIFIQKRFKNQQDVLGKPLPNPNWQAVETFDKHSTLVILQKDSQKPFWLWIGLTPVFLELKGQVLTLTPITWRCHAVNVFSWQWDVGWLDLVLWSSRLSAAHPAHSQCINSVFMWKLSVG